MSEPAVKASLMYGERRFFTSLFQGLILLSKKALADETWSSSHLEKSQHFGADFFERKKQCFGITLKQ